MHPRRWLLLPWLLLSGSGFVQAGPRQWSFRVFLDDKPIGTRVFTLREQLPGCLKTFAYWNPAILAADRLLNAQTGRWEKVTIEAHGRDRLANARGQVSPVNRYRILGPDQPITLWYDDANRWVGLESRVSGGRKLAYRLE